VGLPTRGLRSAIGSADNYSSQCHVHDKRPPHNWSLSTQPSAKDATVEMLRLSIFLHLDANN
jgi:hypothetical protein